MWMSEDQVIRIELSTFNLFVSCLEKPNKTNADNSEFFISTVIIQVFKTSVKTGLMIGLIMNTVSSFVTKLPKQGHFVSIE